MRHLWLVLFFILSTPRVSADYLHAPTGLAFPDSLGTLELAGVTDMEKQQPGLGVSLRYQSSGMRADIYVYTHDLGDVPEGVDETIIPREFKGVLAGVLVMSQMGRYADAKVTGHEQIDIGGQQALAGVLEYREADVPRTSHVLLTGHRHHFVKVRFTYATADKEQGAAEFAAFAADLGKLLSHAQQPSLYSGRMPIIRTLGERAG